MMPPVYTDMTPVAPAAPQRPMSRADGPGQEWNRLYRRQILESRTSREHSRATQRQGSNPDRRAADRKHPRLLETATLPAGVHPPPIRLEPALATVSAALTGHLPVSVPDTGARPGIALANGVAVALLGRTALVGANAAGGDTAPRNNNAAPAQAELAAGAGGSQPFAQRTLVAWIGHAAVLSVAGAASPAVASPGARHEPRHHRPGTARPADAIGHTTGSGNLITAAVPGTTAARKHRHDAATGQQGTADPQPPEPEVGGLAGRHYGTVPLLVSDRLLELEFVALGPASRSVQPRTPRSVRMTLRVGASARVALTAQHHGDKVTVRFAAGGPADPAAGRGFDIAALLHRLGWGALPVEIAGPAGENTIGAMP